MAALWPLHFFMTLNIQKNILLAPYTTFKIGGPAKYFSEAESIDELRELCSWAKEERVPVFVLGGGSNLLVNDEGFNGLVIKIMNSDFQIINSKIIAGAGVSLSRLVLESVKNGLSGLEWAIGIPGTIGGAVCGNCGAYGHSISESVMGGKIMNSEGEIIDFRKEDFLFRYRGSILKNDGNKLVIIEAEFELAGDEKREAKEKMREISLTRAQKIPPYPSAGSFFKNYVLDKNKSGKDILLERFPELQKIVRGGKIAAGIFIEQCGLKGKTIGGAKISEQHANFIVNIGNAKAADVLDLAEICKREVKDKFGIELEIEKRLLGF